MSAAPAMALRRDPLPPAPPHRRVSAVARPVPPGPTMRLRLASLALLLLAPLSSARDLPAMKFGEVKEIAPGVFFRYSSISPTDPSVFGGSNHAWVVFDDYVVVIDAN